VPIDKNDKNIKMVTVGSSHICAIDNEGTLQCWGDHESGQTNVPIEFSKNIKIVTAGTN